MDQQTQTIPAINPLDAPGTAFEIELCNPKTSAGKNNEGPWRRVSFVVDKDAFDMFMEARNSIRLMGWMVVLPDTDEEAAYDSLRVRAQQCAKEQAEEKREEEQATPEQKLNGRMWSKLIYRQQMHNCPGVREALEGVRLSTAEQPDVLFHRLFNVESMRDVSPARALEMFDHNPQAELMIERAARDAAQPSKGPDGATVREVVGPEGEMDGLGLAT